MAVYASPNASRRRFLWRKLHDMRIEDPLMLLEDFKCVLKVEESNSNNEASFSFVEWVDHIGLIDLDFSDPRYTWNHKMDI